jgi:hypothetical protein
MNFSKKTVVFIIAVFLLPTIQGCYTKLKHPRPALTPETADTEQAVEDWDFGDGWYPDHYINYPDIYHYYYVDWWYDCSWCDDYNDDSYNNVESDNQDAEGKITRRDNIAIPYNNLVVSPFNQSDNGGIVLPPKSAELNPEKTKSDDSGISNTSDDEKGKTKITHRGRR